MTKNSLKKAVELIAKGNAAEAVSLLEQELASGNIDTEVMVCLGIAYVQSEQPEMAIDVLTQVLDRTRDQSVVKLFLGRAYKATGKYDLAMEHLSDVLMLDPQLPEAWSDISEIHYLMGRCDLALSTLDDSIRRFPKDPMLHRLKALILQRLGDYTESVREFELAFRLRPDTLSILVDYMWGLVLIDCIDEVTRLLPVAQELGPGDERVLLLEAELNIRQGDLDSAESTLLSIIGHSPSNVDALVRLALVSRLKRRHSLSKKYLMRSIPLFARDECAWLRVGPVLRTLGESGLLVDCLTNAADKDPGAAGAWIQLALEYSRLGLPKWSMMAWYKSIQIRGYVKVFCPACRVHTRFMLTGREKIEELESVRCQVCGRALTIPDSLSHI